MFDAFDAPAQDGSSRRLLLAGIAAAAVCGAIALAVASFSGHVERLVKAAQVDVIFRPPPPPIKIAELLPPPKPKPLPKAAHEVSAPAPLAAPKEVPLEQPQEADDSQAVAAAPMAVGGTGALVAGATVSGNGTATGLGRAPPINLPEEGVPPAEDPSNAIPAYPDEAKAKGLEGLVILKVVVEVDGRISHIQVMRGEEPFASAALRAVRSWRYRPAVVAGQPTAVFRILKIPFRIRS